MGAEAMGAEAMGAGALARSGQAGVSCRRTILE